MTTDWNKGNVSEKTYHFKFYIPLFSKWTVRSLPLSKDFSKHRPRSLCCFLDNISLPSGLFQYPIEKNLLFYFHRSKNALESRFGEMNPVFTPLALMTMTFCCRSMKGWIRQSRGSCFWLRHTPLWFTTIQLRSYSSPWFPRGHLVT